MSQPGNNQNETNTTTGTIASNTILNAATKRTKSILKQDNIAWRYKGFLTQTIYKKKNPSSGVEKSCSIQRPKLKTSGSQYFRKVMGSRQQIGANSSISLRPY